MLARKTLLLLVLASCGPGLSSTQHAANPPPDEPAQATAPPPATKSTSARPPPAPVVRPDKPLSIAEARRYMLALVNRDRATEGLAPVELDEGPAQTAGQAHAEDMVKLGYLGHWGSDGSIPEQRHTEAGGADMVLENALCFTDEKVRTLDGAPVIDPKEVEKSESQFFDEKPPNDGHRKNILRPMHTRVGIGVAQPKSTKTEIAVPCFAQEFVDGYGSYAAIPKHAKLGSTLHVEGTLTPDAQPTGVGVARVNAPKPMKPAELNKLRSYPVPKPFQMYWGPGFVTPVPMKIDGKHFSVDVRLDGQPGLYEISVWAKLAPDGDHTTVGLRTLLVD
ncbi:MAG TPA: CAP domain-containing protein [Labilithrix sp.]